MDKPKRKTFYKHCIVRSCGNNSTKSPGKAYIRVPLDQKLRHKWLNAIGRKTSEFSSTNKGIYVCEDHFDLESDMENYLEWNVTGAEEIMKKTAVPRENHSKGMRRELDQLLWLHEEISIKNEQSEEQPSTKVNVTVSKVLGDRSPKEDTVSVEGLVNAVVETNDLETYKKLKNQTSTSTSNEQNINLAMNIQINIQNIVENEDSFGRLANSEAQTNQSDIYKKQKLAVCGVADRDVSRISSSTPIKYASSLFSKNLQQKSPDLNYKNEGQKAAHVKSYAAKLRRSALCPLCCKLIGAHLPRHLERHHKDHKEVRFLRKLNPNSQERARLLATIRKRGYFRLNIERNLLIPVRASRNPDVKYFVCPYCLGHYSKRYLYRHVKQCDRRPIEASTRHCLSTSQTFMAEATAKRGESIPARLREEVFGIMRPDNISCAAKNDPLIRLYGARLLAQQGRRKIPTAVSNKMREMGRLLLALRAMQELAGLVDALKPDMFQQLMAATTAVSGYDPGARTFRSPSLAYHMGNNLRFLCAVALDNASDDKKIQIQQLKTLLHIRWSGEFARLTRPGKPREASRNSPLTNDLQLLVEHVDALALEAFERLNNGSPVILRDYNQLVECVLGKTVLFNRESVHRVQRLSLEAYGREERVISTKPLTGVEQVLAERLKTVVCGDRDEGFVLIPDATRVYIDRLLRLREETDVVTLNSYLFAEPGSSDKWIGADGVLRELARGTGAENPDELLSGRFRDQIATTLQLMAVREEELERLATTVGLRSPENIHQKAELARLLLEKQQGIELPENNLEPEREVHSKESEEDDLPLLERLLNKVESPRKDGDNSSKRPENSIREQEGCESTWDMAILKVSHVRFDEVKRTKISWSEEEKSLVRKHFSKHIRGKISPKKLECVEFLRSHPQLYQGRGWVQLKAFVYNTYRMMQ